VASTSVIRGKCRAIGYCLGRRGLCLIMSFVHISNVVAVRSEDFDEDAVNVFVGDEVH
jgi:hypothetical protein